MRDMPVVHREQDASPPHSTRSDTMRKRQSEFN